MILELPELTIRALLERSFSLYANAPAIGFVGELPKSYDEVRSDVNKLAAMLLSRNIKNGDRVAILGDNSPNWVISYLAITFIGAVAVPILPGFPDSDIRHIVRNSESCAIFLSQKSLAKIDDLGKSHLHTIFLLEDFSIKEPAIGSNSLVKKTKELLKKMSSHKSTASDDLNNYPKPNPDGLAAVIYTSGTTGHSKGVMLTHKNIVSDVVNSIEKFPIDSKDRFLSILPLSHTFEATGGMLCALAVGVTIFYMQGLPTPQKLIASMEVVRPTGLLAVPLVIDKIYRKRILPKFQKSFILKFLYRIPLFRKYLNKMAGKKLLKSLGGRLRFFMFGGAALNPDVELFLRESGISYSTGYGLTETAPILTINPFGKVRMGSCGQAIPGVDIKIYDPDPTSGIGEIIVRGPNIMQGYYKNSEATKEVFLDGGWFRTGDLGYFDSDNYLFIKGRSKNVIVGPSGENIYPEIIEQQILQSPFIQEVVVYQSGGKLIAKAYLDYDYLDQEFGSKKMSESAVRDLCRNILEKVRHELNKQLPQFSSVNRIVEYRQPFEKTPTNKVKRYLYISED